MTILNKIIDYTLIRTEGFMLTVGHVVMALTCLLLAKLVLILIKKYMDRKARQNVVASGRFHSLYLICSYFIWTLALLTSLQLIGLQLNFLLAGGAALMVGIGLGLQNVFNDFVSGIIILMEGTIEVNDVIQVDGLIGKVAKISIRYSEVVTLDDYSIIIPNHYFISDKVVNWTHNKEDVRFSVDVGVAYGSDTAKVIGILESIPQEFPKVSRHRTPFARFESFGDSSLDFKIFFWSPDPYRIEPLKSKIRLRIDERFREEGITIPFPQRDLHIIGPKSTAFAEPGIHSTGAGSDDGV